MISFRSLSLVGVLALGASASAQPSAGVRFGVPAPGTLSQPANVIYGIDQDADGALWIASELGLHRYDGVSFEAFRADPERPGAMPGNRVTGVSVAPDGSVWAGVDRFGVVRYDPATRRFERFRLPAPLAYDPTLVVDGRGEVWISTGVWESGFEGAEAPAPPPVYRLDPERRTVRRVAGVRTEGWGLFRAADGTLWVDTRDGVAERTATGWRRHRLGEARFVPGARPFVQRGGELLGLGPDGRFRPVPVPASAAERLAGGLALRVDRGGRVWLTPDAGQLEAVDLATGRAVQYAHDGTRAGSLPDGTVLRIVEDREGVLWLGTGHGLRALAPGWDVFASEPLRDYSFATLLTRGASGRVWGGAVCTTPGLLGTDGLVPMADVEPAVAAAVERSGMCVANVLEASDGTFWFSGWPFVGGAEAAGVLRVRPDGTAQRFRPARGDAAALPHAASRGAFQAADGRVWVLTEGGLARLGADGWRTFRTAPGGLEADIIWSLADADGGRLWVGTYGGGLSRLDPATGRAETWRRDAADPASLPSDNITAVVPSAATPGVVWVGTYDGGLARLVPSTGRVTRVGRADGLPGLNVKSIVEEASGRLWVGTDAGLVRYDPATRDLRVYTEADGLPSAAFGLYDAARLPDGRLAFGVGEDLVTFDPERTEPFALDARVALRALRVEGTRRTLPGPGAPIRLRPDERSVGVEVVALSFRAPQRLRYAVRLDGVDERWIPLGADRSAAWAGLAPGRYTLRARAGLASGRWSPETLAVPVIVEPAWWERRSVRALAALLAFALLVLAVRDLSQRRLRRQVQALEVSRRLQRERERISRDLHDHVGAQLSSLLAGVELARLARERGPRPGLGDPLDAVEGDARTTMRQLRETIWALHGEAVSLGGFCERVRADLAARAGALRTEVVCHGDAGAELSPMQALNLYRIVQEAVTNTLKYAGAASLTVAVRHDGADVTVAVRDDGTFQQPAGGDGLSGFGMRSMAARAEALGGTLEVGTAGGTTVCVSVPATAPDASLVTSGLAASELPASGESPALGDAAS